MKRLILAAIAAITLAGQADARALVVVNRGYTAITDGGIVALQNVILPMLNTLGASYDVADVCSAPQGATDALRRGTWFKNGSVNGDSASYGLIIIIGDDRSSYQQNTGATIGRETSVGGIGKLHTTGLEFAFAKPGMLVTGTGITGVGVVVGVDSSGGVVRLAGTVAGSATVTAVTWRTPVRPDSLTLTYDATNGYRYPKVPILRFMNNLQSGSWTTSTACSTGVDTPPAYAASDDSTKNVYEVGNPYRSWKSRIVMPVKATRDPRGWRPILGSVSTRQINAGLSDGNYDFPVSSLGAWATYSTNPDTVVLWVVQNRDAAGVPIGGDAAPNIYCVPAFRGSVGSTNIEPGVLLTALALGDSLSGGALFGSSDKLPRQMAFHIDDGWKRGDSRFASSYGGIGVTDTTALKASIDSLAALQIPFVVGVELDSLDSVLLATGVTGHGDLYDRRWWARAPMAKYTPHMHAGLSLGTNREQNNELTAGQGMKFLRPLDVWGLTRARYAFGSVDSALAYRVPDFWNDVADSGSTYWLNKRALYMADSAFGSQRVDRLMMPAGDDWTVTSIKHTQARQHGLGVDSTIAAAVASGATGIRVNAGINVAGNADSVVTNNYGYYPNWRRMTVGLSSGGAGMPTWLPVSIYGRSCELLPTNGYPGAAGTGAGASVFSWSQQRNSHSGEQFLLGLLTENGTLGSHPTTQRGVFILASHASDFGSSGRYTNNEATRPMFYTFKYVTNAVRVANAHARRPLVAIVYPDQVRP